MMSGNKTGSDRPGNKTKLCHMTIQTTDVRWLNLCQAKDRGTSSQRLLYRWTEHSILSMTTGGGKQCLIMLHKLTQSL